jgi:hypothetical protein
MTNPRAMLEHVSLVRGLLAASEHPDVARVGRLGEITYLVDELVALAELEIYDGLSEGLNARNTRQLHELRQALLPYVGQNLLRAGMQCEFRQHTIYVDPRMERIVHLVGFCLVEPPEAPKDASPADQARWIFDHPRDGWRDDGRRVVEVLLAGRDVAELSSEELRLLARGYNFWGHHAKSFETAKLGLARERSAEWLALAQQYAWNAFLNDLPRLLTACDTCIAARVGPAAFWHLLKADRFIDAATGESELEEFEWSPGHPILHPEFLRLAAESLEAALGSEPGLWDREADHSWVGDWNKRFAPVLQEPAFRHLKQPGRTP